MVGDIDIAVFFKDNVSPEKQNSLAAGLSVRLSYELGFPVDVRPLYQAPAGFRYHVTRGVVMLSRDEEARLAFVEATWQEFLAFKPLLAESLKDLLEA